MNSDISILQGLQSPCRDFCKPLRAGFSLVEVALAILILSILVSGAMSYHYFSARDVQKAEAEVVAGRLALLLLEGWKGTNDPCLLYTSDAADE